MFIIKSIIIDASRHDESNDILVYAKLKSNKQVISKTKFVFNSNHVESSVFLLSFFNFWLGSDLFILIVFFIIFFSFVYR